MREYDPVEEFDFEEHYRGWRFSAARLGELRLMRGRERQSLLRVRWCTFIRGVETAAAVEGLPVAHLSQARLGGPGGVDMTCPTENRHQRPR